MKRILVITFIVAALCCCAFAQTADDTPATKEDVQKYFEAMHIRTMMTQMMDAMAKPMHQMVHDSYVRDQDKLPADFEEQMNKMMDGMFKDLPWDQMLDAMIPAYQKYLTKGDLEALTAFYSTPAGQKLLRVTPAMTGDAMQAMMPLMQDYMKKMQDRIQDQTLAMMKQSEKKPDTKN